MSIKQKNVVYTAEGMHLVELPTQMDRYRAYQTIRNLERIELLKYAGRQTRFLALIRDNDNELMAVLQYSLPNDLSISVKQGSPISERQARKIFLQYTKDHQIPFEIINSYHNPCVFLSGGRWMTMEEMRPGMTIETSLDIDDVDVSIPEDVTFKGGVYIRKARSVKIGDRVNIKGGWGLRINRPCQSINRPDQKLTTVDVDIGADVSVTNNVEIEAATIRIGDRFIVGGDVFLLERDHTPFSWGSDGPDGPYDPANTVHLGDDSHIKGRCHILTHFFNTPANLNVQRQFTLEGISDFSWNQRHENWQAGAFALDADQVLFPEGGNVPYSFFITAKRLHVSDPLTFSQIGSFTIENPISFDLRLISCPKLYSFRFKSSIPQRIGSLNISNGFLSAPRIEISRGASITNLSYVEFETLVLEDNVQWFARDIHIDGNNIVMGNNVRAAGIIQLKRSESNLQTGDNFQLEGNLLGEGGNQRVRIGNHSKLRLISAAHVEVGDEVEVNDVSAVSMMAGNNFFTFSLKIKGGKLKTGKGLYAKRMELENCTAVLDINTGIQDLKTLATFFEAGSDLKIGTWESYGTNTALNSDSSVAILITDENISSSIPACVIGNKGAAAISYGVMGRKIPPHTSRFTPHACSRDNTKPAKHAHVVSQGKPNR